LFADFSTRKKNLQEQLIKDQFKTRFSGKIIVLIRLLTISVLEEVHGKSQKKLSGWKVTNQVRRPELPSRKDEGHFRDLPIERFSWVDPRYRLAGRDWTLSRCSSDDRRCLIWVQLQMPRLKMPACDRVPGLFGFREMWQYGKTDSGTKGLASVSRIPPTSSRLENENCLWETGLKSVVQLRVNFLTKHE